MNETYVDMVGWYFMYKQCSCNHCSVAETFHLIHMVFGPAGLPWHNI